jgi:hypothetical protein
MRERPRFNIVRLPRTRLRVYPYPGFQRLPTRFQFVRKIIAYLTWKTGLFWIVYNLATEICSYPQSIIEKNKLN